MSNKYGTPPSITEQQALGYSSQLGTPVYSDFGFIGDTYTDSFGKSITYTAMNIPSALFVVKQQNNIVRTSINGASSEIVEFIGNKNYEIDVRVVLSNMGFSWSATDVLNLMTMLNSNQIVQVNSWFLNYLGIKDVTILDKELPQREGWLFNQVVTFKLLQVVPLEIQQIINPNSATQ